MNKLNPLTLDPLGLEQQTVERTTEFQKTAIGYHIELEPTKEEKERFCETARIAKANRSARSKSI